MRKISLILLPFLFMACSDNGVSSGTPYDKSDVAFGRDLKHKDFVFVKATGHYTTLGTATKEGAVLKETPAMRVNFDYDFSMAAHEITQKEYYSLMEGEPCGGCEDYPITNVTYGDIVVYANAKSIAEGLDTVYTYSDISYDANHHVLGLENLEFHPDVEGYRLPTEAEWVFVATKNWNVNKSWTNENSEYKLHKACEIEANSNGFCDLIGNVTEWVNDWAGYFKDTTITNYVGAPDGGSDGERVIKGGAYNNSPSSIQPYSRGDVYKITGSSMADYVGARLAIGTIPDPIWLQSNGSASASFIKSLIKTAEVRKKFGTMKATLVFVNGETENLVYVNFNDGLYSFHEIEDNISVHHPDISPNGEWVAFSTGEEGTTTKSELYVRRIDIYGTYIQKLDVESAAIPRFRINENGDTVIVYVTSAGNNKEDENFNGTSTWEVPFEGGAFGTPRKLMDGAYHGGISPDNRLAVTGARILRARMADGKSGTVEDDSAKDTIWYNEEQACNASLSKDGSNRTAFLDFRGETGLDFVGKDYKVHERLLITDSTGKLIQSVGAPSGTTFDYTEWVGDRNMVIAALTKNKAHSKIALIDLKDSSIMELVQGTELQFPCLWVNNVNLTKEEKGLNLDSLGAYMTQSSDIATNIMKTKMDIFWKNYDSADVIITGSSRTFAGVDPFEIKSHFALNMSYSAQDFGATEYFIKNYFLSLVPNLKAIVIALDYDRWHVTDKNFKTWFGDIPGFKYDEQHSFWKDGVPERMYELTQNALTPSPELYDAFSYHNGLFYDPAEGVTGPDPSVDAELHWFDNHKSEYKFNLNKLQDILEACKKANVLVVGIIFPQSPYYAKKSVWGRYGLTLNDAEKIHKDVQAIADEYDNFIIVDEYKNGKNDYLEEDFANNDHLGLKGAIKLTTRLDSLLEAKLSK